MKTQTQPTAKHALSFRETPNDDMASFEIKSKDNDKLIGCIYNDLPIDEAKEYAARIVKCVNMHDELVENSKRLLSFLEDDNSQNRHKSEIESVKEFLKQADGK